jgi:divalent metal cation (Fe/Co/Zn/Cd) transporter
MLIFNSINADNVEMEIVLPGNMTVRESHDIALVLQHKIERLPDVERAFVHVDHNKRDGLEHKVERKLIRGKAPDPYFRPC